MFYRKTGTVLENITVTPDSWAGTIWKRVAQTAFDAAHPVGELYIQYPGQSDPNTLYNSDNVTCTWENVSSSYAGRFFRVEGGNAATFSESSTSGSNQGQETAKNSLSASFSGSSKTVSVSGANHTHSYTMLGGNGTDSISSNYAKYNSNYINQGLIVTNYFSNRDTDSRYLHNSGTLSMSGSYTPSGSVSVSGGTETRPVNATCRIWKRTA